jgi:hypothetical protein
MVWSSAYFLNNWSERKTHLKNYLQLIVHYCVLSNVLRLRGLRLRDDSHLSRTRDRLAQVVLFIPSWFVAVVYNRRKVS